MRDAVLILYWLPSMIRSIWRVTNGRLFVFRDEPAEYLRFMLWYGKGVTQKQDEEVAGLFAQLRDEVAMRQRRGEWV